MIIAFVGAHGTGKTTTCRALHKHLGKQWLLFDDQYRHLARQLGYANSGEPIRQEQHKEITATAISATSLGSLLEWTKTTRQHHGLIDLGPASILAYHRYWMKNCDKSVSPFLLALYRFVASKVDYHVYLSPDVFSGEEADMRSSDPIFQKDIDQWVLGNLEEMHCPKKIIRPKGRSTEERVCEILNYIRI